MVKVKAQREDQFNTMAIHKYSLTLQHRHTHIHCLCMVLQEIRGYACIHTLHN